MEGYTVASEDIVMQFAVVRVCVMAYSRNKPSPPPPPAMPATSQPGPPPPPQPAVPPPVAAGVVGQQQQQQQTQQGPSAGPVGAEETDDTMKNLRKTFAGIFGNM